MLVTIISTLILTRKRMAMQQLFPESVIKLWNEWELRAMVLTSLGLQTILILIGNWRKHSTSNVLRVVLWIGYLSADSTAIFSLGLLSSNQEASQQGDSVNPANVITAFWAPFLLLHLGGPDTIAAYSLEDNELWLRHLLRLGAQLLVVWNVSFRAWSSEVLNFLALPMFVVGIIKYWERTLVLRSASSEQFRDSMLHDPDPGPNYARYMEEYCSKRSEGFRVDSVELRAYIETPTDKESLHIVAVEGGIQTKSDAILKAYNFFQSFKLLFADLILSYHDIVYSRSFFQNTNSGEAFKVIELELGFIFDVFYTKANLVYSRLGGIFRCITVFLTVCVFLVFHFTKKQRYGGVDVIITYVLLAGAIVLEFYALVLLLSSDRTMLWLDKHKNKVVDLLILLRTAVSSIPLVRNKKWSNTLAQHNIIIFSLKARPTKGIFIQKVFRIHGLLEKQRYKDLKDVPTELKKLIFEQLKEKSSIASKFEASKRKELCARRGDLVLEKAPCLMKLGCSIKGVEFDQSILLWHIATDLCYYSDVNRRPNFIRSQNCKHSRLLSNYMLYLLVMCPFMLPNGIGQIRYRDTCAEAEEFFKEKKITKPDVKIACKKLLDVCTDILPCKVKGDRSKSVLFDACRLAKALQLLETKEKWENKKKWELISHVWVEMLSFAANQCRWSGHAQQLRRGGELITHVWLLMAHLGLTEQFQISEGHVRAKLIVE